ITPGNEIARLPEELGQLTELQELNLGDWLAKKGRFRHFHLQGNQLKELPTSLEKLTNLQYLNLSSNQLKELPTSIEKLTNLWGLDLSGNQLTKLPISIEKLTNLKVLDLNSNQLTELPTSIEKLTNLQVLYLSSNQLTELPSEIENLEQLWHISLDNNPLGFPPLSIAKGGMEEVRNYLAQEVVPLWVAKMVVVGQGRVGKTSLLKRLRDDDFDQDLDSTHGMDVDRLVLPHPSLPGVEMTLNTWDFGGQDLYHATHQFYLTDRSLYLIVWNAGENYQQGGLLYWLDTVKARAPKAKIILVATHADQRTPDIPFDEIRKQYEPMIADRLYLMDNKNGAGREDLLRAIAEAAAELKMMGQKWPVPWTRATEAIRERAKTENHITPHQLTALLTEQGVDEIGQRTLTRWLHQLGEILFYDEDQYEELNDTVMLNPHWVNQIISRVLDSKEVEDKKGVFTRKHMEELWKEIESPLREHLLRLMDQFDLSYKIPDEDFKPKSKDRDRSLVVEKLPREEADYHSLWESKAGEREISRKLELATLLPGIPSWFIARAHRFTTRTHWRLGALFEDGPERKHLALVRASATEKWVALSVRGPSPHNFFALLSDSLMKTFERFPGLDYKVKVPCCCSPNCPNEFELEDLESAYSQNVLNIPCLKAKPIKQASVPQMLLGQRISPEDPLLLLREIKADTEQLKAGTARIEIGVSENLAYQQREFTKLFNALQSGEETYCPNVFALRTGGGDGNIIGLLEPIRSATMWERVRESVWKRSVELQLYCQQPGHWHPVGCERGKTDPESGLYQIEIDSEFLQTVGPYLIRLSKVMKYVLPALGMSLPWIVDKERYEKLYKADLERWTKFADAAAKTMPELFDESAASKAGRKMNPRSAGLARGDELRLLRSLLAQKDPNGRWGKLRRFMTKEGHWLWLCSEHWKEYQD
ncbi:MAG TPA: COR domain-containing protein, partial [Blastocatellia bacterium]|nr:COR domain-containing protein [Blastocatellia bacterium]